MSLPALRIYWTCVLMNNRWCVFTILSVGIERSSNETFLEKVIAIQHSPPLLDFKESENLVTFALCLDYLNLTKFSALFWQNSGLCLLPLYMTGIVSTLLAADRYRNTPLFLTDGLRVKWILFLWDYNVLLHYLQVVYALSEKFETTDAFFPRFKLMVVVLAWWSKMNWPLGWPFHIACKYQMSHGSVHIFFPRKQVAMDE